jgi:NADH-quinone oxidoreductase subunit G
MVRQEARLNKSVNGFFICDRGRYGFSYESLPERPRRARIGREQASWDEALQKAGDTLARIDPASIACLGSARSSLENQGMLKRFCRLLRWEEPRYFETRSMARKIQRAVSRLDKQIAVSLREIEGADFILAVGVDPINEAPMLALAMRQAFRGGAEVAPMFPLPMRPFTNGATVAIIDPRPVSLPLEFDHFPVVPGEIEPIMNRLVKGCVSRDIVAKLGPDALRFYDAIPQDYPPSSFKGGWADVEQKLLQSKKPVIICGTDIVRESTIISAADDALLLKAAKGWAGLFYVMPSANTFGAALLSPSGDSLGEIIEGIEKGRVRALIVVENDPFWLYPDGERLEQALGKLDLLLVLDYLPSRIAEQAHIFFPTAPLFDTETRFVNQEGRIQWAKPVHAGGSPIAEVGAGNHPPRMYGGAIPGGEPKPAWRILAELAEAISAPREKASLPASIEDLWRWMVQEQPAFAGLQAFDVPPEGFRILPDHSKEQGFPSSSRKEDRERMNSDFLEVLPVDWTFGTEELSSYSRFIQQVENPPSLMMHARDAARLGFKDQDKASINLDRGPLEVGVRTMDNMASGIIILPRHRQLAWQKFKKFPARIPFERIRKM